MAYGMNAKGKGGVVEDAFVAEGFLGSIRSVPASGAWANKTERKSNSQVGCIKLMANNERYPLKTGPK